MNKQIKLCLFQGTFNPIHNAHIKLCEFAIQKYSFDKIIIVPASKPPHKNVQQSMSKHRLEMVKLAAKGIPYLEVSDIEYQRNTPSYTYDTIVEFYKKYNVNGKINFIIGTDAFKKIETWYKSDLLKELLDFILFVREDINDLNKDKDVLNDLKNKGYNYKLMELPFLDISSTMIRESISKNISVKNKVPEKVERYINDNGLYK